MTLLINSNKDFDFVDWVIKTPCIFFFRSAKFHAVKETHDVSSLLALVKIVVASQHERQRNKSLSRFVDNRKHRLRLESPRANTLLVYVRLPFKNFCKLAKQAETMRNSQKEVLVHLWLRIVWETHKFTQYQSKEFSYITFLYRTKAKV